MAIPIGIMTAFIVATVGILARNHTSFKPWEILILQISVGFLIVIFTLIFEVAIR